MVKRQQWLNKVASQLKYLAETFHLPVIVTNQVTTGNARSDGGVDRQAVLSGTSAAASSESVPASLLLQEQDAVASSGKSSDVQFREYMASGLGGGGSFAPSLRPALGNTWAHSVNTRLFLDVNAKAGSNHGSLRSIHITKSPTAPYSSVPFQLGAAGIMESRAQDAPDCNGRQPHSIQTDHP